MESSNFPCILLLKPKERTVQNMDMILKTTNLCKSFNGQTAVNNISLNIEKKFRLWIVRTKWSRKIYNTQNGNRHFEAHIWEH